MERENGNGGMVCLPAKKHVQVYGVHGKGVMKRFLAICSRSTNKLIENTHNNNFNLIEVK